MWHSPEPRRRAATAERIAGSRGVRVQPVGNAAFSSIHLLGLIRKVRNNRLFAGVFSLVGVLVTV